MENELKTPEEILTYLNEAIKSYGESQLKITQLNEIHKIYLTLNALEKAGITTDNYGTKRKAYYKKCENFFDSYGIEITDSYPFSNPKDLYLAIDNILTQARLNPEQRRQFYLDTELRARSPKKQPPKKGIFDDITLTSEELDERSEEAEYWDSLSTAKQDEISGITPEDKQFIEEQQEADKKHYRERAQKKQLFKLMKYTPTT